MHSSLGRLRLFTLSSLILLPVACGGGSDGGATPGPTPSQLSQANRASLVSSLDLATNRVTLRWSDVTGASRYQIEQQDPSGAWVAIDGVWAPPNGAVLDHMAQSPQWTGVVNGATTFRVEAVLPGANLPLGVAGAFDTQAATSVTVSAPAQLPSIELDQPEPLESAATMSLVNADTYQSVAWDIDGPSRDYPPYLMAPSDTLALNTLAYTTGSHVIHAVLGLNEDSTVVISRSVRIQTSRAAIASVNVLQSPNAFDASLIATSDSGIVSVAGIVDGVPMDTLTAPNTCLPLPCSAGQPFNAYRLSIDPRSLVAGTHVITEQAIDNAGNTAWTQLNFETPAPVSVTLDSPVDGAVAAGTLHVSGMFSSGTPGALEIMVTLSGVPVYDTTAANTGAWIPYTADVSLAGVASGYHTVSTYARVGNAFYTQTASAVIQVTTSP